MLLGGRREGGAWRVSVLLAFVRSGGVWRDRAVAVVHHGHGLPERVDVVEEQLQRVQVARIVPVPAQRARQFRGDLPRRGDGAVAVDGPGGEEPVRTRDEGRADGFVAVVEFVELHEVQHVGFDRGVERVGREGDMGDRVAVYSRLAAWGVGERVGCQADVYGEVGEVMGEWGGEYGVPVAGGGGGVGEARYDAGAEVRGRVVVGCKVGEVVVYGCRCSVRGWVWAEPESGVGVCCVEG